MPEHVRPAGAAVVGSALCNGLSAFQGIMNQRPAGGRRRRTAADFEPAWQRLAELYLRLSRWSDLEELLERLEAQEIAVAKVGWLRARGQVQRKECAAARKTLARVIAEDQQALGPRVLLSQALIQEGRDWSAAEKALLDVLELDPENKDARHNLKILKRQRSRVAVGV